MMKVLGLFLLVLVYFVNAQFVTRSGSKLMLNGEELRAGGCNIYWLGLDQNNGNGTGAVIDYPSQFRVDDALLTAVQMGHTVVRAHTLGVSTGDAAGNSKTFEPHLNEFNHEALSHIDYAVYRAGQLGIKLIVPLTDNYHYYHGGKHDFTDWRGITEDQFYYNQQVISDFKNYVTQLLTHKNQYNGIAYKDDPTVLAWETGNEIHPPVSWTKEISEFLKTLDPKHLVLDGTYGINNDALSISTVDMYSDHFYPIDIGRFQNGAHQVASVNKVYVAGEYGWTSPSLQQFLNTALGSPAFGVFYWSLLPHRDDHGFEQHDDGFTIHYPGDNSNMQNAVSVIRNNAFAFSKKAVPTDLTPQTPLITYIAPGSIAWRGATVAYQYSVERSTVGTNGPFTVICDKCVNDNQTPWDSQQIYGGWYRVRGFNLNGVSGPYSPVVHHTQ